MQLEPLFIVAVNPRLDLFGQIGHITGVRYFKPKGYDSFYPAYTVKFNNVLYAVAFADVDNKNFRMVTMNSVERWRNNSIKNQ